MRLISYVVRPQVLEVSDKPWEVSNKVLPVVNLSGPDAGRVLLSDHPAYKGMELLPLSGEPVSERPVLALLSDLIRQRYGFENVNDGNASDMEPEQFGVFAALCNEADANNDDLYATVKMLESMRQELHEVSELILAVARTERQNKKAYGEGALDVPATVAGPLP